MLESKQYSNGDFLLQTYGWVQLALAVQCGTDGGGGGGGVGGNRITGAPGGLILLSFGAANAVLNDETARRLTITKIR
jgi:hypothetical protein